MSKTENDLGTTGRVTWRREEIDFSLIKTSPLERSLFRFQKNLPEFVWNTTALEGNTFTLPEVRTLLDGVTVGGKRIKEAKQVLAISEALNVMTDARERALAYFASATRSQFYYDGNKRTARIMMTGELMKFGYETISVPYARKLEFNLALEKLFREDDATEIMSFLTTCTLIN